MSFSKLNFFPLALVFAECKQIPASLGVCSLKVQRLLSPNYKRKIMCDKAPLAYRNSSIKKKKKKFRQATNIWSDSTQSVKSSIFV